MYIRAAHHDLLTHMFSFVVTLSSSSRFKTGNTLATTNVCVRACVCVCVWVCVYVGVCVCVCEF